MFEMLDESSEYEDFEDDYFLYNAQQIFEYCIIPTITQAFHFVYELILFNVLFLIINRVVVRGKESRYHITSTLLGLSYIYLRAFVYNIEALYLIALVYTSFIILNLIKNRANAGFSIGALFISILISCEFIYIDHEAWLKIRGIAMVAMMKNISLAFEYQKGRKLPSLLAYSGYIWCPANSVLGPWIPYKDYAEGCNSKPKITLCWIFSVIQYLTIGIIFLVFSNCINIYLIHDDNNEFAISYREAASFRMSHYFVSYLGSAAMVAAGFTSNIKSKEWCYMITNPLEMEIPRSLVNVVINWNIPAHLFLKKYIFPSFLPYGQLFAILMTYLVSSMLHGLSIEVSAVLLSLGLFSYGQFKFQDAISFLLSACVRVRPCRSSCDHKHKQYSLITIICNILFSVTTIVYLAYIGCLMENVNSSSSAINILWDIVYKWQELYYIGHVILVICVVLTFCIRRCI